MGRAQDAAKRAVTPEVLKQAALVVMAGVYLDHRKIS
jgi:hypothetical protein